LSARRAALAAGPLLAILLYLPTIGSGFVFDDEGAITQNPLLRDLRDLPRALVSPYWNLPGHGTSLYRPLTTFSFALDRALVRGFRPGWFHGVNLLLHAAATFLVALLAAEILPRAGAPLVAGVLFAAHPVHVEAVAGVVGRAELLAACGALGAVLASRRALMAGGAASAVRWGGLAAAASFLGMCGKESAATIPLLCALADAAFPPAPAPSPRRRATLYLALAASSGAYLMARWIALGSLGIGEAIPFVDNPASGAGPVAGRLTALACVVRYAALVLWPARLAADYSFDQLPIVRSLFDPMALLGLAIVVGLVAAGAWCLRRRPVCGLAFLWIPLTAGLTSNLVVFIGTLLAERLMYLPSVGAVLLFGWVATRPRGTTAARAAAGATVVLCVLAAGRTLARLPDWRDDFALYESGVRVSPRSARLRYNLGNAYLRRGEYRRAEEQFHAALAIYPDFLDARVNAGMAMLQQGRAREALGLLREAADREPRSADLAIDLGTAYRASGEVVRAESEFRRALSLDPGSARAWNNLGSIEQARGDAAAALGDLRRAVDLDPAYPVFRVNLADLLLATSAVEEAEAEYRATLTLDPAHAEARRGLGEVALKRGDLVAAEASFRAAAAAEPPSARAADFLGYLLARKGDARGAAREYERALAIDPSLADAHRSLGLLYAQQLGERGKGAQHLEMSLRLDPGQAGAADLRRLLETLIP
jgi:tetratricopeptide (TPR) repeat protein